MQSMSIEQLRAASDAGGGKRRESAPVTPY